MKKVKKVLSQVIADFTGFVPHSIDVLRHFRIAENHLRFDVVYLVFVPSINVFYVIWRWTTSRFFSCKSFNNYDSAVAYYLNRHDFVVGCNSLRY